MHNTFGHSIRVAAVGLALAAVFSLPSFAASGRTVEAAPVMAEVAAEVAPAAATKRTAGLFDAASWEGVELDGLDPQLLALALEAAGTAVARGAANHPGTLSVIDFSKPSTAKRLWVYDLRSRALLFHEHVAHGRGTGANMAEQFSNVPESNQSSLGLFRTAEAYIGKHGYSLRLDGLERGVNDRARERAIVIHGADYVNAVTAKAQGRLGRSLGCPAVRPEIATPLIKAVKDGGLLFAYYPDQRWLDRSEYLN